MIITTQILKKCVIFINVGELNLKKFHVPSNILNKLGYIIILDSIRNEESVDTRITTTTLIRKTFFKSV